MEVTGSVPSGVLKISQEPSGREVRSGGSGRDGEVEREGQDSRTRVTTGEDPQDPTKRSRTVPVSEGSGRVVDDEKRKENNEGL